MHIQVSPDGHYFQQHDGTPFFYLGDTAWMLFNKLTEDQARALFADRAAKGFTVIQAVVFRDLFEPNTPNAAGVRPFASDADMRAVRINPAWLEYVVRITRVAGEYGLVMGLLPTWGDKWNEHSNSAGPVIMDQTSGRAWCHRLSDALGDCENVIWILGGDSPIQTQAHADTLRAMAEGLRAGASGDRLISFHPPGRGSSAIFHAEPWLDFNALQTSHGRPDMTNYIDIERLSRTDPPKPCLEMECAYEMMPIGIGWQDHLDPDQRGKFTDYDVRRNYYRTVLAGAAGFTYGCEAIRQVYRQGDRPHAWDGRGLVTWREGLAAPGSSQLALLKQVLLERSYFTRIAAQELLLPIRDAGAWADHVTIGIPAATQQNIDPVAHIRIARCRAGRYIIAYIPIRQPINLDTSVIDAARLRLSVYDPRTGERITDRTLENAGRLNYVPRLELDTLVVIDALAS